MSDFKLDQFESSTASGLDAFFQREPQILAPFGQKSAAVKAPRTKVASLAQLEGFSRVSAETLVHKSTQDLWAIKKEGEDYYIERLFAEGAPVKG